MNDDHAPPRPVSIGRAIRTGFRDAYDHMGYVVFATFVSFLCTAAVLSLVFVVLRSVPGIPLIAQLALMLPVAFVGYICAVGVFYYAGKSADHEHPAVHDTLVGIKKLFVPALGLFVVDAFFMGVLGGDAVLFLAMFTPKGSAVFLALSILCAYLSIVSTMMAMYHLPLLVAQLEMESGPRTFVILRKSFLLMADNPGFTVVLFLVIIAFAVVCALLALVGMALLFLGVCAFLLTHALRELFTKYGILEEEPEIPEDKPWRLPDSWRRRDSGTPDDEAHGTRGQTDG